MSRKFLDDTGLTYLWGKITDAISTAVSGASGGGGLASIVAESTSGVIAGEVFNVDETNNPVGANHKATGNYSHAEGDRTQATGKGAHAEGITTQALGEGSHAEGWSTIARGRYSHAEGAYNIEAGGDYCHAEGFSSKVTGQGTTGHVEGNSCYISGRYGSSHVEGESNSHQANAGYRIGLHIEGSKNKTACAVMNNTSTVARGGHMEGQDNFLYMGNGVHVEGFHNIGGASEALSNGEVANGQHIQGRYCVSDLTGTYAHVVGNGTADDARSNAHTLDWSGNAWYAGTVEATGIILPSTTSGSTKRFLVTVDDSGTLTATEIVAS